MALHSRQLVEPDEIQISQCPRCSKTVPEWAEVCQFCGYAIPRKSELSPVDFTRRGGARTRRISTKTWTAYYTSAALFILGGVYEAAGLAYVFKGVAGRPPILPNPAPISGMNLYGLALGILTALFGIAVFIDSPVVRRLSATVGGVRLLVSILLMGLFMFGTLNPGAKALNFFLLSGGYAVASLLMVVSSLPIASAAKSR
jgi:hypothetical protein